jgi:hypothetical protein
MTDKLKMDAINALQQPLFAMRSGDSWPIYDICVATGLVRIDVVGKLQVIEFGELLAIEDGNGDRHDTDGFYIEDETGNDMHTDTDAAIADLIARRSKLEVTVIGSSDDAEDVAERITEINLQIMRLQGKQAHQPRTDATADAVKSLLQDAVNADARRSAEQGSLWNLDGIEEKIVWTTKDGKQWPTLEGAIKHQRIERMIDAMVASGDLRISCISRQVAENADEIFAILEPFFRKGE